MIASIVIGVSLFLIGLVLKFSNVARNSLFGYRTFLSMKNDTNWAFANGKFARHSLAIGLLSIALGISSSLVSISDGLLIFVILTSLLISILIIEIGLRKFDKHNDEAKG